MARILPFRHDEYRLPDRHGTHARARSSHSNHARYRLVQQEIECAVQILNEMGEEERRVAWLLEDCFSMLRRPKLRSMRG